MSSFHIRVSFSNVDTTAPYPLWSTPSASLSEKRQLVCNGHCKFPIADFGVNVDLLNTPLPPSHEASIGDIATRFFTSIRAQANEDSVPTSQLLWYLSASRPDQTEQDPHFTNAIKSEALLVVSKLYKLLSTPGSRDTSTKAQLFVDIITDNCGSLSRDFPKATDGSCPASPQRVTSQKHLESLVSILSNRKASPKAPKTFSLLVLSPISFDVMEWMAAKASGGAEGGQEEDIQVPPVLIIGFVPTTAATSQSLASAYAHVTEHFICTALPSVSHDYMHARGGVGSLCCYLQDHTDRSMDVVLFVQQQYGEEENDASVVPSSNLALIDLIVSQNVERAIPASDTTNMKLELAASRQRISKLEMLLKLKSSASTSDVKDHAVFQRWSDAKFEVDILREIVVRQEAQIDGLYRELAFMTEAKGTSGVLAGEESEEAQGPAILSQEHSVQGLIQEPPPISAVELGQHPQTPSEHRGIESNIGLSAPHLCPVTFAVLAPELTPVAAVRHDHSTSSSSSSSSSSSDDDSSTSSSSASQSMEVLLQEAQRERLQSKLKRSFNSSSLYSHEVEDDLTRNESILGIDDGARVIRWRGSGPTAHTNAHRTRRQCWQKMYRSIQKAASRTTTATVVPVRDFLQFFEATFDCGLASSAALRDLTRCIQPHHLLRRKVEETLVSESEEDEPATSYQAQAPWVNTRMALSAVWNPLRLDIPKVTSLVLQGDKDSGAFIVGQRVHAMFTIVVDSRVDLVSARLRWYRSHPIAADPHALYLIREEQPNIIEPGKSQIITYRVSAEDVGSYIWFEVVPRIGQLRSGAAASVATDRVVALPVNAPQIVHLRLSKRSSDFDYPVGRFAFVGDLLTAAYELVGWPLEGPSRLRWCSSPSHDASATRQVLCSTLAPANTIVVPSSCAYHVLLVEVTPVELATGQAGPTVTSLGVVVLPRPQVLHVMTPQLDRISPTWSYTWTSGTKSSLAALWTTSFLDHRAPDIANSEGGQNCRSIFELVMNLDDLPLPTGGSCHLGRMRDNIFSLLRAQTTRCALLSIEISITVSLQDICFSSPSSAHAAAMSSLQVAWRDVQNVREVAFPQAEKGPLMSCDRPCFVRIDVAATPSAGTTTSYSVLVVFSNALSAEIFVHLVRLLSSISRPSPAARAMQSMSSVSTAVESLRSTIRSGWLHGNSSASSELLVNSKRQLVWHAWARHWIGISDTEECVDLVSTSLDEKGAFKSLLFPFLCE